MQPHPLHQMAPASTALPAERVQALEAASQQLVQWAGAQIAHPDALRAQLEPLVRDHLQRLGLDADTLGVLTARLLQGRQDGSRAELDGPSLLVRVALLRLLVAEGAPALRPWCEAVADGLVAASASPLLVTGVSS